MIQRIMLYIIIMLCGVFLGRSGKLSRKILEKLDLLQLVCLLFLLFAMGISMGTNAEVMSSFSKIGLKSVIFSVFTISFSVLAVFLFNRLMQRGTSGGTKNTVELSEKEGSQ